MLKPPHFSAVLRFASRPYILSFALLALVGGCAFSPPIKTVDVQEISDSKWDTLGENASLSSATNTKINDQKINDKWWQSFHDATLKTLIGDALSKNLDIRIAQKRLEEADAFVGTSKAKSIPSLAVEGSAKKQKASLNGTLPLNKMAALGVSRESTIKNGGFVASWEIDLFGSNRNTTQGLLLRRDSLNERKHGIVLSVSAEVARTYFELRGLQYQLFLSRKNQLLQKQTFDIVQQQKKTGAASSLDLSRARTQWLRTKSLLPALSAKIRTTIYRLSVLCDKKPTALIKMLEVKGGQKLPLLETTPTAVPLGLKSSLLTRRPDVRAAERLLEAEKKDIKVAKAMWFPKFYLTGSAGGEATSGHGLFSSESAFSSVGPSFSWPIFQGGAIRARIKAETAQAQRQALVYEKTVLGALSEAQSAFILYQQEQQTYQDLVETEKAAQRTLDLARQRYKQGLDSLLSVLDAERQLSQIQNAYMQSKTRTLTNLVSLYKALGGGWEDLEQQTDTTK